MSSTGGSLTSLHDSVDNSPAKERNYLSHDKLGDSHCADLLSSRTTSSICTTQPISTPSFPSLGQLVEYATSEEDEPERAFKSHPKKGRHKKTIVSKSAAIVASDSSESDTGRRLPRQVRTSVAKRKQLQTSAPLKHHKRAIGTVSHKATGNKPDHKTAKTKNMTAKRRPTSSFASSSITKRPSTKGGFVVTSSDESDSEGSDASDQDDSKHGGQSRSPAPPPSRVPARSSFNPANLRAESTPTSLPTKQLNKSRLNTLLGRIKGATTLKGKEPSLQAQRSTTVSRTSTAAPSLNPPLKLQHSTPVQSKGSSDADHGKRPTTASTAKEVNSLGQQPKVVDSSVSKVKGKAGLISQDIDQPSVDPTTHGRVRTQVNPTPTPRSTTVAGPLPGSVLQQRKSVPGASTVRGRKAHPAAKPMSLLQLTLNDARSDSIDEPCIKARVSGRDELNVAKRTTTSTPSTSKSDRLPQPSITQRNTGTNDKMSKKRPHSPARTPKASGVEAAQRLPDHTQVSASKLGKFMPDATRANATVSKSALEPSGQPAQKRKLDSISGGSGLITGTAPKRPALPVATSSNRLGDAHMISQLGTSSHYSVTTLGPFPCKVPAKTSPGPSVLTSSTLGLNSGAVRIVRKQKPTLLSSSAVAKSVEHERSVANTKGTCVTPAISHLPAHPGGAAVNKSTQESSKLHATPTPKAKSIGQPDSFVAVPTDTSSSKSRDPTQHASAASDVTHPTQQKTSCPDLVATSSLDPSVSLEQPTAANSDNTILKSLSEGATLHPTASTPQPKEVANSVVIATSKESTRAADSGSVRPEEYHSSPANPYQGGISAPLSEPIVPVTGKEPASTRSTTMPEPTLVDESRNSDLAKPSTLELDLSVSVDTPGQEVPCSGQTSNYSAQMDVDSVDTASTCVRQDDATTGPASVPKPADDGPPNQIEAIVERRDEFRLGEEPISSPKTVMNTTEIVLTPPISPPVSGLASEVATDANKDVFHLSNLPAPFKEAQPYFEYSVFQKIWQSEQIEEDVSATEVTVRPFTNIDEANAQAEKTFESSRALFIDIVFETSNNRDEHGCSILTGSIAPFDHPTKKSHLKIWVQRDPVSKFADQTPQILKGTSFISSTCYILRLFKLIAQPDAEDSDSSDSDSDSDSSDPPTQGPLRTYHAHTRPEIYTTLSAANRAARALQIELSHEKEPKDALSKAFQEKNLRELNAKVVELASSTDGGGECWKSKFNACGLGGDSLEILVEKSSICGPRNL